MSYIDKKTDRRIVRSKEALKQALLDLMVLKDYDTITITEIVDHADYNRGTFYSHYDNKEALLDDIMQELIEKLLKSFRAPYEHTDVLRMNELPATSIKIFEHIYQHASVYSTLLKSNVIPNLREKMFLALKEITMDELEQPGDINSELLVIYSIHALLGLVFHWIESGFTYSPSYMQEQLVKIINWRPVTTRMIKRQ